MVIRADKRPWDMPEDANRVGRTHRLGHNPTPESNQQAYAFFEGLLKE